MSNTYLNTPFKDKDAVKALGARWDANVRKWYVPAGRDLAPFSAWLPAQSAPTAPAPLVQPSEVAEFERGIPLSQLLGGVAQAVAQAYQAGVWTRVEVVRADVRRGHVYLELAERSPTGELLAQARGMIWASTANKILPAFEQATGAQLAAGLKLLVRAKPEVHPVYGLSLAIDAIDPQYTLGDLEAKKREIRTRLQQEGLYDANRRLPQPWDYQAVLVIAPQGAAGLGDFSAEAERLARHGVCRFVYAFSRFQGEGAAAEIRAALLQALEHWRNENGPLPDAVVIIRGGGAVNDLAWLNDYELARSLCELEVPVLTGIGHERDSTVLDEVANLKFDTPSKAIHGIEQVIRKRSADARDFFEKVMQAAQHGARNAREAVDRAEGAVRAGALGQLAAARQHTAAAMGEIRLGTVQVVHDASQGMREALAEVRQEAQQQLLTARQGAAARMGAVLERCCHEVRAAREGTTRTMTELAAEARRSLKDASTGSEALMREIAGQGPEKTLGRGFAVVSTRDGRTLTGAAQVQPDEEIEIRFRDGRVPARTTNKGNQP